MGSALLEPPEFDTPALLEAFFERSRDGCFFMMLDRPVEWTPTTDKRATLDYVFAHQRMTRVNRAMAEQFRTTPTSLIGLTPADFFQHDLEAGRRGWSAMFDAGHDHRITDERRHDGSAMWVEGDYICLYDSAGRIIGHFGTQRDVTERIQAAAELEQSQAELRALAAKIQGAREEERARIAREIHDELGQALTALKFDLAWLESGQGKDGTGARALGEMSITARIDQTMEIVRRIASELRPSILDQLGLEAAVEWLVQQSAKHSGIEIALKSGELPRLPDQVASHIFRIVQEALTNVARHAKARKVNVTVKRLANALIVGVEDDGIGIMPDSLSGLRSLGLVGIRERAVACGGNLIIRGEPGKGTSIVVTIPVPAQ